MIGSFIKVCSPNRITRCHRFGWALQKLWHLLLANIRWLVGKGDKIQFWKDNWLGKILAETCNIVQSFLGFLNDKVNAFISNGAWNLPASFQHSYPIVAQSILATALPVNSSDDQAIWASSSFGLLDSKSAYLLLSPPLSTIPWGSSI